jgi:hypothetical protein
VRNDNNVYFKHNVNGTWEYTDRMVDFLPTFSQMKDSLVIIEIKSVKTNNKLCQKCGQEYPFYYFDLSKSNKDGLQRWCKNCMITHKQNRGILKHKNKYCYKCCTTKEKDKFYKSHSTIDGYFDKCIDCVEKELKNDYHR